jgi:hypothetical protein
MCQTANSAPSVQLPVMLVADVQDSLLVAMHDLHRLETLLTHATDNLLLRFTAADVGLASAGPAQSDNIVAVRQALNSAVTELQFHDMASQLIVHTSRVLQGCAHRLAYEAMGPDEDEVPIEPDPGPGRPNPVTQSEMDAGSVDLF